MTRSDSSFRVVASDKEGMILKVIGLLFFVFLVVGSVSADDYVVLKGDTPATVAFKKKIPVDVLQRANPDLDGTKLKAGDKLFVPEAYVVKAGETLYSLGRQWNVDVASVVALNNLPGSSLKAGQTVYIPHPKVPVVSVQSGATPSDFWPVDRAPRSEGDKLKSVSFPTTGEAFRSVSSGTVVFQGEFRGVGRVLMVQRDDKVTFAYGNFEKSSVEFGQTVARGQVLGASSSRPSQRLLFFVFRQNESLDTFVVRR